MVTRYLAAQAKAGHLNTAPALSPELPSGERFVHALQLFLRQRGYLG